VCAAIEAERAEVEIGVGHRFAVAATKSSMVPKRSTARSSWA
jgi:hypothetical protein